METILKAKLAASSSGVLLESYRAVLIKGGPNDRGARIAVQQPFNNGTKWQTCAQWYLDTLLCQFNDSISIDYGQQWSIEAGMQSAITEAAAICALAYKEQSQ